MDVKSSTAELIWLYGLRQAVLFPIEARRKAFSEDSPECEIEDCLPWKHGVDECVNMRLRERGAPTVEIETPLL